MEETKTIINLQSEINSTIDCNNAYMYKIYNKKASNVNFSSARDLFTRLIKSKYLAKLINECKIVHSTFGTSLPLKLKAKNLKYLNHSLFLEYEVYGTTPIFIDLDFDHTAEDLILINNKNKLNDYTDIDVSIYYDSTNVEHLVVLDKLMNDLNKNFSYAKTQKSHSYINLVVQEGNQIKLKPYTIKNPEMHLELAYGKEFSELYPSIVNNLVNEDKGLWIFHSDPGAGKSILIRSIIAEVNEKLNRLEENEDARIIYLPSEMVKLLEDPSFIPFISKYPGSILVIEDADVALQSREMYGNIVQTVLNLTDGILSDCLKIKILATFNCHLDKIDKALLRKGRLQLRHEFTNIPKDRAIELAKLLNLDITLLEEKDSWSLADVYNLDKNPIPLINTKKGKIGFNSN